MNPSFVFERERPAEAPQGGTTREARAGAERLDHSALWCCPCCGFTLLRVLNLFPFREDRGWIQQQLMRFPPEMWQSILSGYQNNLRRAKAQARMQHFHPNTWDGFARRYANTKLRELTYTPNGHPLAYDPEDFVFVSSSADVLAGEGA